ncbi:MAG: hypothetical protein HGA38_01500 [Candidatus Moranbacteria bacterium]|nr:hypothetical protein [Candidatus Moranbacteria bacterium]
MEKTSLAEYVAGRIRSGAPKGEIREELLAVGWSEEEADAAYRDGVVVLGAPVPSEGNRPTSGKKSSTADIILNLFSFILLGMSATAAGVVYFQVVNRYFPDPLAGAGLPDMQALVSVVHYSIAALLIAFPLYIAVMRMWFRKFREDEGRTESRLSKWLTYLVLLGTSVTMVGDLITLVFTFLQGELTMRFFLKALIILAVTGGIFGFYFFERRKIQYRREVPARVFSAFAFSASAVAVVGIALGLLAGGSPASTRSLSFDVTRESDLRGLSDCIGQYAAKYGSLPASLDELRRTGSFAYCADSVTDPETGDPYGYRVVNASRKQGVVTVGEYELCADFSLASTAERGTGYRGVNDVWSAHAAGHDCDIVTTQLGELAPTPAEKVMQPGVPSGVK